MCMEDIRIGRKTGSTQITVTVSNPSSVILPADAKRTAIVISPPAAGTMFVAFGRDASTTSGIRVEPVTSPLILDLQHHGNLVTGPLHGFCGAGAESISIWFSRLEDE